MGGVRHRGCIGHRALLNALPITPRRGRILNMRSIFYVGWAFVGLGLFAGCADVLGIEPWEDPEIAPPDTETNDTSGSSSSSSSSSGAANTCSNSVQDGDETGVDCGGGTCKKCPDGRGCTADIDCEGAYCPVSRGYCVTPNGRELCGVEDPGGATCADCIKNGSESDVDCGAECLPCRTGQICTNDAECWSALCMGGRCEAGPKGTSCFSNADCASGSCGTTSCANGTCCQ
jgi:hypothetical protein